jgi:hypothetical protein
VGCDDTRDALALAAVLNSPLAGAWLNVIAEPARGGYRRYLGWTVARLPLPSAWTRARELLAAVATELMGNPHRSPAHDVILLDAVLDAFALRHEAIAALLGWTAT